MDATTLLKQQVEQAHGVVQGTVADLTSELAAWKPAGTANSIAPILIHLVVAEDVLLKMMTGQQPLAMALYQGKTGASEPTRWATTGSGQPV